MPEQIRYESSADGMDGLVDAGVPRAAVRELYAAVTEAADALIAEYDIDGVDTEEIAEQLQIAYAELLTEHIRWGVRDPNTVDEVVAELDRIPDGAGMGGVVMAVGRVATRSESMMQVAGTVHRRLR